LGSLSTTEEKKQNDISDEGAEQMRNFYFPYSFIKNCLLRDIPLALHRRKVGSVKMRQEQKLTVLVKNSLNITF